LKALLRPILINLEKISDCKNQLTDKDNPDDAKKSSHWYRSAVSPFPAFCYLLVPNPTRSDTSELTLAQALSTQEREEQLRSERRVQAPSKLVAPKSSDNPVQCFAASWFYC